MTRQEGATAVGDDVRVREEVCEDVVEVERQPTHAEDCHDEHQHHDRLPPRLLVRPLLTSCRLANHLRQSGRAKVNYLKGVCLVIFLLYDNNLLYKLKCVISY